jgi:hypothetical protein
MRFDSFTYSLPLLCTYVSLSPRSIFSTFAVPAHLANSISDVPRPMRICGILSVCQLDLQSINPAIFYRQPRSHALLAYSNLVSILTLFPRDDDDDSMILLETLFDPFLFAVGNSCPGSVFVCLKHVIMPVKSIYASITTDCLFRLCSCLALFHMLMQ